MYLGDAALGTVFYGKFTTRGPSGLPTTLSGSPALRVYKDGSTTELSTGVTLVPDFDSLTGLNHYSVDTSSDASAYVAGEYTIVLTAGTVTSVTVAGEVIAHFSLNNRSALRPTTAGRTLDVSAGGEAGVDWANVGSPTTTVGLSGTTVKTATDVETDTADIQSRLPAALVSGRIDASVGAMAANVITATAINADAITAAKVAADVHQETIELAFTYDATADYAGADPGSLVAQIADNAGGSSLTAADIADAVWDEAQSGHVSAGSFGEIATEIAAILVDTGTTLDGNITAILADTNELQTDWANGGRLDNILDARASQTSVDTIDGIVDDILTDTGTTLQNELDGIQADTEDIQSRLPAALTAGGNIKADVLAISGATSSADRLERSTLGIVLGTCDSGGAETTIIASALDPTSAVNDQFVGRIITFDKDTTTAALRGQSTDITDYVHATLTFTVTALTTAPASGDTFVIT